MTFALRNLLTMAIGSLVLGTAAHAAPILNGSFESPVLAAGSAVTINVGSTLGPWSVVGGNIDVLVNPFNFLGYTFNAFEGQQSLDLQGNVNDGALKGVAQSVATVAGQTYELSFSVGNIGGPSSPLDTTVFLFIDGALTGTGTNSFTNLDTVNWQQFAFQFTAAGALTEIQLLNGTAAGDIYSGLDDVVLTESGSEIPEPSTGLLVLGVVPVLAAYRRFRQRNR